jgi:alpha-tubulin suppressor-like RCC1 family protein
MRAALKFAALAVAWVAACGSLEIGSYGDEEGGRGGALSTPSDEAAGSPSGGHEGGSPSRDSEAGAGGEGERRIVKISAGLYDTCALLSDGALRCWGENTAGQLGLGRVARPENAIGDDEHPNAIEDIPVGDEVMDVSVSSNVICAVLRTGKVRCWGDSWWLGYPYDWKIGDDETPAEVGDVDVGENVREVSVAEEHTCVLLDTGAVRCWGKGDEGRLGYGNTRWVGKEDHPAGAGDVPVGGPVKQISTGLRHTCALLESGGVRCWGFGGTGLLGYGNREDVGDDETPLSQPFVELGGRVRQIASGNHHNCALLEDGRVRCWGTVPPANDEADPIGDDETPASRPVVDLGGRASAIATGGDRTCALVEASNALRCWGKGAPYALGYGNVDDVKTPADSGDLPLGDRVISFDVGHSHLCALLENGDLRCWGDHSFGLLGIPGLTEQIGDDEPANGVEPVRVF